MTIRSILVALIAVAAPLGSARGADAQRPAESPRAAAVRALIEQATTAANAGHFPESLALADRAIAQADRTLRKRDPLRFEAERRRAVTMTFIDEAAAPAAFDRVGLVGDEVYGRDSFEALFARFKGTQWKYSKRATGVGLPQLAESATRVAAVAKGDEQVTLAALGLAILANYTSTVDAAAGRPIAARAVAMADSVPTVTAAERGQVYAFTATIALRADRPADALALSSRAAAIYEIDQGPLSNNLVTVLGTQADAARRMGDPAQAERYLRRAVGIVDAKPQLGASLGANAMMDYARLLGARGNNEQAFPLAERAVESVARLPITATFPQTVIIGVGRIYQAAGRHDDALRHFRRALTMTEATREPSLFQGQVLAEMGRSEFALGDLAAAQATAERALGVYDRIASGSSSARGKVRMLLADLADARGDSAAAADLYAEAARDLRLLGPDPANAAPAHIRRAAMLARIGRLDDDAWRAARDGGDALIRGIERQARDPASDRAAIDLPAALIDGALDAAWAIGHREEVRAK